MNNTTSIPTPKFSIGDFVFSAEITPAGIEITKLRVIGVQLIQHSTQADYPGGWNFDKPDFEISYFVTILGRVNPYEKSLFHPEILMPENQLFNTPEDAINNCVEHPWQIARVID